MAIKHKTDAAETVRTILSEDVISLTEAREELSKLLGVRVDKASLCRWIHRGVHGCKLEAVRLGERQLFTSQQALTRFIVARTQALGN